MNEVEIDRLLKRVNEGNLLVCDIFTKFSSTSSNVQKDKLEGDLKKEIKKLQRFREQIKIWLGSNDVKNKSALEEAKSIIEEQMEKFKLAEKSHRIKAFSKEGLSQPDRLDPELEEREKVIEWLSEMLKDLELQCDTFEGELETLKTPSKKNKHSDAVKSKRMAKISSQIERHRWHIYMLENVHRLLSNEEIEIESVKSIMNDVSHYVETNEETDCSKEDCIYNSLNLNLTSKFKPTKFEPSLNPQHKEAFQKPELKEQHQHTSEQGLAPQLAQPVITGPSEDHHKPPIKHDQESKTQNLKIIDNTVTGSQTQNLLQPNIQIPFTQSELSPKQDPVFSVSPPSQKQPTHTTQQRSSKTQKQKSSQQQESVAPQNINQIPSSAAQYPSDAPNIQEKIQSAVGREIEDLAKFGTVASRLLAIVHSLNNGTERDDSKKRNYMSQMLQTSLADFPEPSDTKCPEVYVPETSYPVPPYYPLSPLSVLCLPEIIAKFDVDILFFIFYYVKVPSIRCTAIKELGKNSWKYHKKLMKWFKRHGEPKVVTDEYEIADYMYFDYESSWCQRKKSDFTYVYMKIP